MARTVDYLCVDNVLLGSGTVLSGFRGSGGRQMSGRHDVRHMAAELTADESLQSAAGAAKVRR